MPSAQASPNHPAPLLEPHDSEPEPEDRVYDFESEALGMPAAAGYGWAQFEFGERIGPNLRYTIARKLGWGMHSSTWLARDRE